MRIIKGFTLLELVVIVSVLAVLTTISLPQLRVINEKARTKTCFENLIALDKAKELAGKAFSKKKGEAIDEDKLWPDFIQTSAPPRCPSGGTYKIGRIGEPSLCSFHKRKF